MDKARDVLYAAVGAGELALEKARDARNAVDRKNTQKLYKDLVKRGRTLSTRIRNSGPTKRARAQTRTARSQVKSAGTSVRKATRENARAARSAASKAASGS